MATMMTRDIQPKAPQRFDPADVVVRYDEMSDTLFVHLTGFGKPGISVPVLDSEFIRVDPVSEEFIGIQLEDFLAQTIYKGGPYLTFAELAKMDAETLDRVREEIAARQRAMDDAERTRTAIEALLGLQVFKHAS